MNPYDASTGWLITGAVIGFAIAFALRKLGMLSTDKAQHNFCTYGSALVAAVMALGADVPESVNWFAELGGRAAIFGLVWFCFGILFTFGVMTGVEKVDKDN